MSTVDGKFSWALDFNPSLAKQNNFIFMLTLEDIKNSTEFQKTVFVTKVEFSTWAETLCEDFNNLQAAVESFAVGTNKKCR